MQHQRVPDPLSLFCVAAPADQALLAQWEKHLLPLQQAGLPSFWSEHSLQAGDKRQEQLLIHLNQADVILLLLSADFFADEECLTLMERVLLRRQEGTVQAVPLLLRPVLWHESPLGNLTCLPANEILVTTWENLDEGWHSCVLGIQQLLGLSLKRAQELSPGKRDHSDRGRFNAISTIV